MPGNEVGFFLIFGFPVSEESQKVHLSYIIKGHAHQGVGFVILGLVHRYHIEGIKKNALCNVNSNCHRT